MEGWYNRRWVGLGGVNWIPVGRYKDQWLAFMNTVMNIQVP
jgi:hypothetical protein